MRGARVAPNGSGTGVAAWPEGNGTRTPAAVVRRRRSALNGRALLGGLLIAVAGVGLFAAYSQAGADHRLAYVVAAHDLAPGERLGPGDLATSLMQLPSGLASADAFRDTGRLTGAVLVAPLRAGELVQASDVVQAADAPQNQEVSFSIDPSRAVGGMLQAGETVAVVATYGTGTTAVTEVVVPMAEVVTVDQAGGSFGSRGAESITLALSSTADVLAVTNAVDGGQVELVRTESPDSGTQPYRPVVTPAP